MSRRTVTERSDDGQVSATVDENNVVVDVSIAHTYVPDELGEAIVQAVNRALERSRQVSAAGLHQDVDRMTREFDELLGSLDREAERISGRLHDLG